MYYLYILHNKTIDKFYIGQTQNVELRLIDHNHHGHKVKYTKKQIGTWELVYSEEYSTRSQAVIREKELKSWKSKLKITELINQK